jgi:hypothetical protein
MDYEVVVIGDINSPHDAIRSLLQTTLTHVAEFQNMILEIICERYGHSMDELVAVIKDDERFQKSVSSPSPSLSPPPSNEIPTAAATFLKTKSGKKVVVKAAKIKSNQKSSTQ